MFDYWKSLLFSALIFTCYVFSESVDEPDSEMTYGGLLTALAIGSAAYNLVQKSLRKPRTKKPRDSVRLNEEGCWVTSSVDCWGLKGELKLL